MRDMVVEYLQDNSEVFKTIHYNSDYINESSMNDPGEWATEVEIIATASLFATEIYVYNDHISNKGGKNQKKKMKKMGGDGKTTSTVDIDSAGSDDDTTSENTGNSVKKHKTKCSKKTSKSENSGKQDKIIEFDSLVLMKWQNGKIFWGLKYGPNDNCTIQNCVKPCG